MSLCLVLKLPTFNFFKSSRELFYTEDQGKLVRLRPHTDPGPDLDPVDCGGFVLTSDSTSRISSPAGGSSFQPTTSTAELGLASVTVRPFSSNRNRTLAQVFPATRMQPRFSVPCWTITVVTGLRTKTGSNWVLVLCYIRHYELQVSLDSGLKEPELHSSLDPELVKPEFCTSQDDSPFAFVSAAFDDESLHGAGRLCFQLQNLRQRHSCLS